jgi:hypothetical protein
MFLDNNDKETTTIRISDNLPGQMSPTVVKFGLAKIVRVGEIWTMNVK